MATEQNKKNPNDRPRDSHGHFTKSSDKANAKKPTPKTKPSKASVKAAKKDAGVEDIDFLTIKVLEFDPEDSTHLAANCIEADGCRYIKMSIYDALLKRYGKTFKQNRDLFNDNTSLIASIKEIKRETVSVIDKATDTIRDLAVTFSRRTRLFWWKILFTFLAGVSVGGFLVRFLAK